MEDAPVKQLNRKTGVWQREITRSVDSGFVRLTCTTFAWLKQGINVDTKLSGMACWIEIRNKNATDEKAESI